MNKTINLVISCLLIINYGWSQSPDGFEKRLHIHQGDTLPFRLSIPSALEPATQYPLVIFLHGAGERGDDNKSQLTHGGKLFIDSTQLYPYQSVVVFPQCPQDSYWASVERSKDARGKRKFHFVDNPPTKPMVLLLSLLDSLIQLDYVDRQRIYVGGLSMGGMGTFELIARRPDTFAAAFPICGGGDPNSAWKFARNLNLWVFHGARDSVVPYQLSEKMVQAIKEAGGTVKFSLYPEANHNSWDLAFTEPEFFKWLFSQVKPYR